MFPVRVGSASLFGPGLVGRYREVMNVHQSGPSSQGPVSLIPLWRDGRAGPRLTDPGRAERPT